VIPKGWGRGGKCVTPASLRYCPKLYRVKKCDWLL